MGLNVICMTPKYYYLILLSQRGSSENWSAAIRTKHAGQADNSV